MISFIGAGKVGSALGLYFQKKGFEIGGYYSRNYQHALNTSIATDSKAFKSIPELLAQSSMVWITVSDDALSDVANELSQLALPLHVKAFVHTSGVYSAEVLKPIKDKGFATYSAHPLMAFGIAEESVNQLNGVYFSLEKSNEVNNKDADEEYLKCFFEETGNPTIYIDAKKKELYHCAASVLSNYLVTLLNLSYEMFAHTGMSKTAIKSATAPLLKSTLRNIAENDDMKDALTGAIKRGDRTTVMKHLQILEKEMPDKTRLYKELGKETMNMLQDYRLKDILK